MLKKVLRRLTPSSTTTVTSGPPEQARLHFLPDDIPKMLGLSALARKTLNDTAQITDEHLRGFLFNALNYPEAQFARFYFELAQTLQTCGYPDLAQHYFETFQMMHDQPMDAIHLLTCALLTPTITQEKLFALAGNIAAHYETGVQPETTYALDRSPEKKLRIGLFCAFFDSSVMRGGILPQLKQHDRTQFEIYCYSDGPIPESHQSCADHWRYTEKCSDTELFDMIQADQIDILRDLSGPTLNHRFHMIARKPAPIQIHGANLACSSGFKSFDYILASDVLILPSDTKYYSEKVVHRPEFTGASIPWYEGVETFPPVSPSPHLASGHVTFGYFGATHKVNHHVVALWCQIMQSVPGSCFIFKASALIHPLVEASFKKMFERGGIDLSRVSFRAYSPHHEMLQAYSEVDIMLDSFPHTGGSTIIEAMWQGVAPISWYGNRWAARTGGVRLMAVGLDELVAHDEGEYAEKAIALAHSSKRLVAYRSELRDKMRHSMLMDHPRFMAALEGAYREMWHDWLDRTSP